MFEVDRKGLAQIMARRGVEFVVLELVQNAFDEHGTTAVHVEVFRAASGHWNVAVRDDAPGGFVDLRHSYTLFAPSAKKSNPELRGRFNLGEKLVIALARRAVITTTTGRITFEDGKRRRSQHKQSAGSTVSVELKMRRAEAEQLVETAMRVLPPRTIAYTVAFEGDMRSCAPRTPLATVRTVLQTERADDEGNLRPTKRATDVEFHTVRAGEQATLYEMGIPVVELDCAWHANVGQKVPLNIDRDNVTPGYRRAILTLALNTMHAELPTDQAATAWVGEAVASPDVDGEAVKAVLTARYGDRRVIADPSDPEGTKLAMTRGYSVIQAGSFSKAQWANIKAAGAALPAGQVTPSPKPFEPGGKPLEIIDKADWNAEHHGFAEHATDWGRRLLGVDVDVTFTDSRSWGFAAAYGSGRLTVSTVNNRRWFERGGVRKHMLQIDELLIHEFAHHAVHDHLSNLFHEECCRLGAKMADYWRTELRCAMSKATPTTLAEAKP